MDVQPEVALGPIGQIHVTVTDIDRSVAFYRDMLGIPFLFDVPGQSMAFLDAGGVRLYLGAAESPEYRSQPLIYFRVPSVRAAVPVLRERGVAFRDEPHIIYSAGGTDLWMAFFSDPDGAMLALMSEEPAEDR